MNFSHWMLVQWTSKLCPFHISKKNILGGTGTLFWVEGENAPSLWPWTSLSLLMILPPLRLVFSTWRAVLMPCSDLPSPAPSLNPYLAMILAATESALHRGKEVKWYTKLQTCCMRRLLSPNYTWGGGVPQMPPTTNSVAHAKPLRFQPHHLITLYFEVLRISWHQVCENRTFHYGVTWPFVTRGQPKKCDVYKTNGKMIFFFFFFLPVNE